MSSVRKSALSMYTTRVKGTVYVLVFALSCGNLYVSKQARVRAGDQAACHDLRYSMTLMQHPGSQM